MIFSKTRRHVVTGHIRRALYIIVFAGLVIYIAALGPRPWVVFVAQWKAVVAVIAISLLGFLIQANAFRKCAPTGTAFPPLRTLLGIWALAAITSLLAPLIASLAIRTTLLKQAGMTITDISIATFRQTYFNAEYAFSLLALGLLLFPWPQLPNLGSSLCALALLIWTARNFVYSRVTARRLSQKISPDFHEIIQPPDLAALPWLWGQIFIMALNYYASFNLTGASLAPIEAVLFSALTILMSLAIFLPNGLGILDGLWAWAGQTRGLDTDESVALALTLRLGNLAAAAFLWAATLLSQRRLRGRSRLDP